MFPQMAWRTCDVAIKASKLDHKALHKLDVGLLAGGEFQEGETDYGTEGDETPGFDGVENSNTSQCCSIF